MEYIFNTKTNCFETYIEQYETKINEETGEEEKVLIPCTEQLYTRDEVNAFFEQCRDNKVLKSVDGKPTLADRYTDKEYAIAYKIQRIAELKAKLSETDYMAIKLAEGELTAEEYAPIKEKRALWRKEINKCEEYIKANEGLV